MKEITTMVTVVSVNRVPDDELDRLVESMGYDDPEEFFDEGGSQEYVESVLRRRVFDEADEIPVLDVTTEVEDK